ncbi:phage tail protein [Dyella psychrodurans]|uniref:Microcystin-dependent protein n=1 Tax=Dyella psychrodurans TaxID=1927960 RepID=A0A370WZ35_9GAMM|nr:tail fiber protein [Dyella psychrodurans]RDS81424.1 microcystin-dependent protein [Dyella psychrodurans]
MSEQFMGQIMLFSGNFAPRNFAMCNGQLLPINQSTALFSLLGTYYGGNGTTNFQLPDLRGRTPVGYGQSYGIGTGFGVDSVTIDTSQFPSHTHAINATTTQGTGRNPTNSIYGAPPSGQIYANAGSGAVQLNNGQMQPAGGSQPHPNMQPFSVMTFCICTAGIYPSRS